jgi:beta-lactamase superfamily II metal-dependent hydrolase
LTLATLAALADDELHLIVFGPGYGESIAVRIPPGEWLVVDSLRRVDGTNDANPAVALLEMYGAQASGIVLTHPHADHADGFAQVLACRRRGAPVGCLANYLDPPAAWERSPDAARVLAGATVEAAVSAVKDAWDRDPASRWDLVAGEERTVGEANVAVLHPATVLAEHWPDRSDLNQLSSPLHLTWNGLSLLLGADLPWPQWELLNRTSLIAEIAQAQALKASHHGSRNAQHSVVIGQPPPVDRHCVVTPWNRGHKLPRYEDDEGMDLLLRSIQEILLTAAPHPSLCGTTSTRSQVGDTVQRRRLGNRLLLEYEPAPAQVFAGWVRASFDATGGRTCLQLGTSAGVVQH